ncbi:ABC transporter related protein [Hydrogenobacter thermophilus TK-6]|uniref:ABC transporter ATP-binding protein n=1 Tax=Hydrogenobacter thermophilus (strain DSM 6534 / IAM 12695 / TK-6) TaxID=608538 RepID=D3DI28_HYDTT|nr:ABC transporter ATP-binding protein [Hydrogenobacter thermophilus]ADO45412.1 ABC transporter related protein [Hydrogenobacter thermophilus TK-6]BAI69480.1 ABC transporter ATP-binding protein [Hydrogenobacter thermophilus TK-6]
MCFIEVKDLTKIYKLGNRNIEALRGVNLCIKKGEFVKILGYSGSGKSTLISIIGGLLAPTSGKVFIEGIDIWSLSDKELSKLRNEKIGFIFQNMSLLPSLKVIDNVISPAIFASKNSKIDIYERAKEILSLVGLESRIHSYPSELSGGEQRRVSIARALINDPDIILADEPTGELDIKTERDIIELFKYLNRDLDKTIIVVTHSLRWLSVEGITLIMKDGLIYDKVEDPEKFLLEGVKHENS